ncbi:MAG: glycosyltransferase family 2 protein [Candidatus Paceibacterota bacterium]
MATKKLQVTLIIPTMNEIEGMKWFMPQLKREWYDELIVVDGGSTDGTIEYCQKNNLPLLIQSGKGLPNALDEAFKRSTKEIIVTITPDGNSLPEFIPPSVEKIRQGYDLVIASRYLDKAKSYDDDLFTGLGNKIFTMMINSLFGGRYTDTLVGFRTYRRDAIERMRLYDQDKQGWLKKRYFLMNSWETGSSIRAAKLKLNVCEIPVDEPKRIGGIRKMSVVKNGIGVLLQILDEFVKGK